LRESSKNSNGEKENNALSKTLQTKEQQGCVHGVSSKVIWKEGFPQQKSMYQKQKTTSTPHVDVKELKRQLRMEVLRDLRPILEVSGIQLPNIGGVMSDEESRSILASTTAGGGPSSIEPNTIDNLAQPIACSLILLVERSFRMEIGRWLVYPHQIMLDDVQIDTSSYAVVKVDMMHDNSKDVKLEMPPDDTTLTIRDVVTRRVQWRWTSIDIDPSTIASLLTTPS
jgi:hypothetical protein